MKIAILVTNTDTSPFAQARPLDGEKFTTLLAHHRPQWTFTIFDVKSDEFPRDITEFDGLMITGSPSSVNDPFPWIATLLDLIRSAHSAKVPMFGACFGHQAIALALGGKIGKNPQGWQHGAIENHSVSSMPWGGMQPSFFLYGSHKEQVTTLPPNAEPIFTSTDCPFAGFQIGNHIFTSQHHPEMTPAFIRDLIEEYATVLGPDITERARASLQCPAQGSEFGRVIAQFFEFNHAIKINESTQ